MTLTARGCSIVLAAALLAASPAAHAQTLPPPEVPPPEVPPAEVPPPPPASPTDPNAGTPPGYETAEPLAVRTVTPEARTVERSTDVKALWLPGLILFLVSYVLTTSLSELSDDPSYRNLSLLPVIGPWLMLGRASNEEERAGPIVGGIAQGVGVLLVVLGLTLRTSVRVATAERGRPGVWADAWAGWMAGGVEVGVVVD